MGLLGKIWVKLGLDSSEFKQGINDSQSATNKFKDFLKGVGQGIAAAFSISAIINFTKEVYKLASAAQGVEMAFKRIAPKGLLADLRNATMNSVDDMQLMQRTVQASNFKIPLEQLATYLQFATKRAIETGQSVDYLVDSIITGLGRQSVMILDNLGLSAAEIRTQMEGGATMAEAVGKLINQDLKSGAGVIETAATNSAQLATAWTNFKTELGQSILGIGKFEKALADVLRYLSSAGGNVTFFDLVKAVLDPAYLKKLSEQSEAYSKMQQEAQLWANEQMKGITSVEQAEKRLSSIQNLKTAKYDALREALREYVFENKKVAQVDAEAAEAARLRAIEEAKFIEGNINYQERLISQLSERIKLETNTKKRAAMQQDLANLEDQLRVMKLVTSELEEWQALQERGLIHLPQVSNSISGFATTKMGGGSSDALKNHQIYKDNIQRGKEAIEEMKKMQEDIEDINEAIERSIVYGISDALQTLIDQLVKTGKVDVGSVVKALVSPFGDMLIQLGEVALMSAIGIEAIKESFKSMNPWVAAAAGVALIALGAAVKAGVASIGASGGRSGGISSIGNQTSFTGGYTPQPAMANTSTDVISVIKGEDIWLINQKVDSRKGR